MINPFRTWYIVDQPQMDRMIEMIGSSLLVEPHRYTTVIASACGSAPVRFFGEETRVVEGDDE